MLVALHNVRFKGDIDRRCCDSVCDRRLMVLAVAVVAVVVAAAGA